MGDTLLKHGKLVDLDLNCTGKFVPKSTQMLHLGYKVSSDTAYCCTGSAPWLYCWMIKEKGYNITGNETCEDPQIMKRTCEFPILW